MKKKDIVQDILGGSMSVKSIADRYGVSRQYIYQICSMVGIERFKRKPKEKIEGAPKRKRGRPPVVLDGVRLEAAEYAKSMGLTDPFKMFIYHKSGAKRRGIGFSLTFDEWWGIWRPHYHERGARKGQKCMCRTLDRGNYEVGNVRIDYVSSNGHEKKTASIANNGTKWGKKYLERGSAIKACMREDITDCQQDDVEEDPFVYYAELVTSHACTKRD